MQECAALKNSGTAGIIEKWYRELEFPKEYDAEFYQALSEITIPENCTIEAYDLDCKDGRKNLLSFLFFCERLEKMYAEKGIDRQILLDTLNDIVVWTNTWREVKGCLYLGELGWLSRHMRMELFRLGRLQFCKKQEHGVNMIDMHIPAIGPLDPESCKASIEKAKAFYAKHYPDYDYSGFTCHSWLLDRTLDDFQSEDSNIRKFRQLFTLEQEDVSDALLRYIFPWDTNAQNLEQAVPKTAFAKRIKEAFLNGVVFHETLGFFPK